MRTVLRWFSRGLLILLSLVVFTTGFVYLASERKLRQTYEVTPAAIAVPNDSAAIARGAHLAKAVTSCQECHGRDGGGAVYADMGPLGRIVGPNLTAGRARPLLVEDWVRAVRSGVRADSRSLIVMPSEVFVYLSAPDLGALMAYYRSLQPVQRDLPRSKFGPLGRALLAAGKLNILVAPKTPAMAPPAAITPDTTIAYGRYLANIAGCHGCHGFGLSGGRVAGPPDTPPASNLTPAALGMWTQADFTRVLREGRRSNGTSIDPFMPWRTFSHMTDDEIKALWLYLQSVPAKQFGNK